jgi:hypothetical protein
MSEPTPSRKPSLQLVHNNKSTPGTPQPADSVLFGAPASQTASRNWAPLIAGFAVVLVAVALIALLGRSQKPMPQTADPYSPMLVVEQARLSQADNFVGSTVTYIDLTTRNTGDRTVVGGVVHAAFRDSLGQPVQTETLPLRTLVTVAGQQQAGDLALAPLAPDQTRVLRITIEHISSEWNQTQPELEFRGLRFK